MTVNTIPSQTFTVREVAAILGLSRAIVARCCQEKRCPAEFHEFPGTQRGFYLLTSQGIDWLRANVTPRTRSTAE